MYKITPVAENNIEVRFSKEVETATEAADGKVEAFIDPPIAYGQARLDEELAALQAETDRINAFDKKAELAKLKEKEDMLLAIDTAMKSAKVETPFPDTI